MGKEVATLIDGEKEAGYHSIQWNVSRIASGVYFYRMNAGDFCTVMKMQIVR